MYIVACHLPRGSKLRWLEDMGGGLTSAWEPRVVQIIPLLKENSSTFEHLGYRPMSRLFSIC